jgi:ABC-type transporter Mla subunit MlaD
MLQAPAWIAVLLFGVLVAVAVPTLLQLRKTLTTADHTLEIAERRLGIVLKELSETLGHINSASTELERVTQSMSSVFHVFERTGSPLQRLKSSLRTVTAIGASLGPMTVAAIRGALGVTASPVTKEMM